MTDEQLAAMHRLLAEHHRKLAKKAALDVVQQYHADLAQRLVDEAALIPRRRRSWNAFMNANNKKRTMAMSTNDTPAYWLLVIAPAKLERAKGSYATCDVADLG